MSEENPESCRVVTELARALAFAADTLCASCVTPTGIDDAFVEVAFCYLVLQYLLKNRYGQQISHPDMLASKRFRRLYPAVMARVDETFPEQPE